MADATNRVQKSTIYIGGLDNQVTTQTLHDAFVPFGEIVDISLPKPELASSKEPHRGFGYVEFSSTEDAAEAIDNMDQSELYGRVIKVNQAKPQKDASEGLGSKTAIWEQEGYAAKYGVNQEGDEMATDGGQQDHEPMDPMQGLEGLAEAGPRMQ
ncbi:probable peptidyl prolyl cis-trans isomerase Cyclophilin [Lecanosticta acicola]|uniref:Probable peptidyl prolyl cis-trans isomerase Cyclophilin n=1 Tax=Lecanosticta acicola TaxID=111012 RepID=A0AAI9EA95_9PEZI|nr:probable peptidyl prolyl cis-trans isomerase Cyclophilin [Lecanosticta acicola]